jgi:hypothetical protein
MNSIGVATLLGIMRVLRFAAGPGWPRARPLAYYDKRGTAKLVHRSFRPDWSVLH